MRRIADATKMVQAVLIVVSGTIVVGCGSGGSESRNEQKRTVVDNTIESLVDPKITIRVDPWLTYWGRFDFTIKADTSYEKRFWHQDIAAGERIVFADVHNNAVQGLFIAQFEGFLPTNDMIYRYNFDNALELGGRKFRNNSFVYNDREYAREHPGNEAQLTREFLAQKGFSLPDDLFMTRFVTVTDSTRKKEMILFYVEDAGAWGMDADTYDRGFIAKEKIDSLKNQLKDKALKSFTIE